MGNGVPTFPSGPTATIKGRLISMFNDESTVAPHPYFPTSLELALLSAQ